MNDTFIHFTPATTIADTPRARLLDDTTVPVAEVDLGPVDVNVRSAGHARRIAAAFVVAADLLDAAQPASVAECAPGACICGAHVDAGGHVTPAGVTR